MKKTTIKAITGKGYLWEIVKTGFFNEAYINYFEGTHWIGSTKKYSYETCKKAFRKEFQK